MLTEFGIHHRLKSYGLPSHHKSLVLETALCFCWNSYLNFLIVCLQILSLCLEPSEQGASVCVRRMNEDKLSVLKLLQHLHPDVGLVGVGGQSAQKRNVDVLENVKHIQLTNYCQVKPLPK